MQRERPDTGAGPQCSATASCLRHAVCCPLSAGCLQRVTYPFVDKPAAELERRGAIRCHAVQRGGSLVPSVGLSELSAGLLAVRCSLLAAHSWFFLQSDMLAVPRGGIFMLCIGACAHQWCEGTASSVRCVWWPSIACRTSCMPAAVPRREWQLTWCGFR